MSTYIATIPSSLEEEPYNYPINVAQFYAGDKKGISLQLSQGTNYIQLTKKQVKELISILTSWEKQ